MVKIALDYYILSKLIVNSETCCIYFDSGWGGAFGFDHDDTNHNHFLSKET